MKRLLLLIVIAVVLFVFGDLILAKYKNTGYEDCLNRPGAKTTKTNPDSCTYQNQTFTQSVPFIGKFMLDFGLTRVAPGNFSYKEIEQNLLDQPLY